MFVNTLSRRVLFNFVFIFIFLAIYILLFYPIYTSDNIMINFAMHPFNICESYPSFWAKLKIAFIPISLISSLIIINMVYSSFFTREKTDKEFCKISKDDLFLFIANDSLGRPINLPSASLYQNILITGTIGSRKN